MSLPKVTIESRTLELLRKQRDELNLAIAELEAKIEEPVRKPGKTRVPRTTKIK